MPHPKFRPREPRPYPSLPFGCHQPQTHADFQIRIQIRLVGLCPIRLPSVRLPRSGAATRFRASRSPRAATALSRSVARLLRRNLNSRALTCACFCPFLGIRSLQFPCTYCTASHVGVTARTVRLLCSVPLRGMFCATCRRTCSRQRTASGKRGHGLNVDECQDAGSTRLVAHDPRLNCEGETLPKREPSWLRPLPVAVARRPRRP